jgi:hypothetical protein
MRRRVIFVIIGAIAAAAAIPSPAAARHGFGGLFGMVRSVMGGFPVVRFGHRASHHRRSFAARSATRREARLTPSEAPIASSFGPPATAAAVAAGPVVWPSSYPDAYEVMLGYALFPREYGQRFWSHGNGDMVNAIFPRHALSATAANGTCSAQAKERADAPIARVEKLLQLTDAQRGVLEALRTALHEEIDRKNADCVEDAARTPLGRLQAMKRGLWSLRDVGIFIRTPLQRFYDALTDEQKAQLNGQASPPQAPGRPCGGQAPGPTEWPASDIDRTIQPTPDQRASLEVLRMTSAQLGQLFMMTCPAEAAPTPLERLDAADERLLTAASAAMRMTVSLRDFNGRLSDEQKARFNAFGR